MPYRSKTKRKEGGKIMKIVKIVKNVGESLKKDEVFKMYSFKDLEGIIDVNTLQNWQDIDIVGFVFCRGAIIGLYQDEFEVVNSQR